MAAHISKTHGMDTAASALAPAEAAAVRDRAWDYVFRISSKKLSGGAKLAWYFLWRRAGFMPSVVCGTAAELAEGLGKSEDSALNYLNKLRKFRLGRKDSRVGGVWTLFIWEPSEVDPDLGPSEIQTAIPFASASEPAGSLAEAPSGVRAGGQ